MHLKPTVVFIHNKSDTEKDEVKDKYTYIQYVNRIRWCSPKHLSLASSQAKVAPVCQQLPRCPCKQEKESHFDDSCARRIIRKLFWGPRSFTEK